jgi:hypothetical protein
VYKRETCKAIGEAIKERGKVLGQQMIVTNFLRKSLDVFFPKMRYTSDE